MKDARFCKTKLNDVGFTLVELLVTVVILVILFSISIPTFSYYLSNTSFGKSAEIAQNIMDYSQVTFYEKYANSDLANDGNCVITGENNVDFIYTDPMVPNKPNNYDCDIHNTELAKKILKGVGKIDTKDAGNIVLLALGRADIYANPLSELYDPSKAYTVYMCAYQPYTNRKVCFLTKDGLTYDKNPRKSKGTDNNTFYLMFGEEKRKIKADILTIDGEDIYIQYYAIKNGLENKPDKILSSMWGDINKIYP